MKIPADQQFLKYSDILSLAPTTILAYSGAQFELQPIILTMSTPLNVLICCHVIKRLEILTSSWIGVSNKVAGEYICKHSVSECDHKLFLNSVRR